MKWLLIVLVLAGCAPKIMPDDPTTEQPPLIVPQDSRSWDHSMDGSAQILAKYNIKSSAPKALLDKALVFFEKNKSQIANQRYLAVVNFKPHSSNYRLFIVDLKEGTTTSLHTAHGSGSDPDNDGRATLFSNVPESHKSSLGFYLTAESYDGNNGLSRRLDGLSPTNSNVRARAIVLHSASYVVERNVQQGRSWGCIVVAKAKRDWVINTLSRGTLIYAGLD